MKVLITGAGGYLGGKLLRRLAGADRRHELIAMDLRPVPEADRLPGVKYQALDIRAPELAEVVQQAGAEVIVHLAAIVTPGRDSDRQLEYSVDVGGTENVLQAAVAGGVRRLIVSSSGAAYGYHPDNRRWLNEDDPLRGNEEFAYAHHKRLVEEMLARYRSEHPNLQQVILRLSTVLGEAVENQITNLFEKPRLFGIRQGWIRQGDSRFVFIWDEDVAACFEAAIESPVTGIFNVAGDGALTMEELAARMDKPYLALPASWVRAALAMGKPLGLTRYGPEQVRFLQYRPVLDNRRLKEIFGFVPSKTSAEVFEFYWQSKQSGKRRHA